MKKKPCKGCKGKKEPEKLSIGLTTFAAIVSLFAIYGFIRAIFDLINLF